jgi:hypothetical protein
MKTCKIEEAIKMLKEHNGLKFSNGKDVIYSDFDGNDNLAIFINHHTLDLTHNIIFSEWTLVKEPVDFITAINAFGKGKTIHCILDNYKYIYKSIKDNFATISDQWGDGVSASEILQGKWYIEE